MSASDIQNRIAKNLKKLTPWAEKYKLDCYRVYERDIPDFPFIVDRYKNHFLIYDRGNEEIDSKEEKQGHYPELVSAIKNLFAVTEDKIILKKRARQAGPSQYNKLARSRQHMVVREGEAQFYVNLYDYLDTGLFLDHRIMRQKIKDQAFGKRFLNLFSYTSSVTVFAALGGASGTLSVDMSKTYTEWAEKNFQLNKLDLTKNKLIAADVLEFLEDPRTSTIGKFDLIFLDPPTFSNSKKMEKSFDVERDQDVLVGRCIKLLTAKGTLYFSTNKRNFKLSQALQDELSIKNITASTIPKDFRDSKIHHVFEIQKKEI